MLNSDPLSDFMGDVTLKEHIETRLNDLEKANVLAAKALDKRLEGMNEFREQLRRQAETFVSNVAYDKDRDMMERDIRELLKFRDTMDGKASQSSVNVAYLIAGAGFILSVLKLILG